MLQRVGLFTGADSVEAWPMLRACEIHVEMDGGPSVRDVANALAHPIVGIVHGETVMLLELLDMTPLREGLQGPAAVKSEVAATSHLP